MTKNICSEDMVSKALDVMILTLLLGIPATLIVTVVLWPLFGILPRVAAISLLLGVIHLTSIMCVYFASKINSRVIGFKKDANSEPQLSALEILAKG